MLRFQSSRAFTLIELMVVIAMFSILLLLTYAPYSFYWDRARVHLSSERILQAMNEARLLASVWASRSDGKNGDIEMVFEIGSGSVRLASIPHGGAMLSGEELIRTVPLEDKVQISSLNDPAISKIVFIYPALAATGIIFPNTLSGVTIGITWVRSGILSSFIPFK